MKVIPEELLLEYLRIIKLMESCRGSCTVYHDLDLRRQKIHQEIKKHAADIPDFDFKLAELVEDLTRE